MKATKSYLAFAICLATTFHVIGEHSAPVLTKQPSSQTIYLGANAAFSLDATGYPAPSFQWRFKDTDLPGKTNSNLGLTQVQFTNAGPYSVVVSNDRGVVTSEIAWLSVMPTNVVNLGDRELRFGKLSTPVWEGGPYR
jgi:hypothetical protein